MMNANDISQRLVFTSDISHEAGGFELKWHQIDLNNRPVAYDCNFDGALPLCSGTHC